MTDVDSGLCRDLSCLNKNFFVGMKNDDAYPLRSQRTFSYKLCGTESIH